MNDIEFTTFTLSDVRCFEGTQNIILRPLTFLVGENSTGKTTALGCIHTLGDMLNPGSQFFLISSLNFNHIPYEMGNFSSVARRKNALQNLNAEFSLGIEVSVGNGKHLNWEFVISEIHSNFEPIIKRLILKFEECEVVWEVKSEADNNKRTISLESADLKRGKKKFTFSVSPRVPYFFLLIPLFDDEYWATSRSPEEQKQLEILRTSVLNFDPSSSSKRGLRGDRFSQILPPYLNHKFESIAPIRSKPKRTYDGIWLPKDSEGTETPYEIFALSQNDKIEWHRIKGQLEKFGSNSGLFSSIDVKNLGDAGEAFQFHFGVREGPKVNLIDVGYGVSQILPILYRIFKSSHQRKTFLMQQPELHLHPKAQAALTSLLIEKLKENKSKFIVETHSDYMVDRARIEIMKGNIRPKDVSLVYFHPDGDKVDVTNIDFDKEANFKNTPRGFRKFFLKETNSLLGFDL